PDEWFDTSTDPEIARSVAAAEAAAKSTTSVMDEEPRRAKPKPGVFDMVPESEGGAAPDSAPGSDGGTPAIGGPQGTAPGQPVFGHESGQHRQQPADQGYQQAPEQRWGQDEQGGYPVEGGDQPSR
ncbi:MAG: SPFH/Band 7/PHB domain protein, partial [Dietzia sp.]